MEQNLGILIILSILPFFESRYVIPLIRVFSKNISFPFLILISFLNCLVFFLVYFFLDFLHPKLYGKISFYRKIFDAYIRKLRKTIKKIESLGYFGLFLYTFIPIPGSGVYTSSIISWILGLNKSKSFLSISLAVFLLNFLLYSFIFYP